MKLNETTQAQRRTWIGISIGLLLAAAATSPQASVSTAHGGTLIGEKKAAPKSNLSADRGLPENSPWVAIPTSDDLNACMPGVTAPPVEKVVAHCVVGGQGVLQNCELGKTKDARMKGWAACILPKFKAKANYRGRDVEVPIQFTDEVAAQ